MNRLVSVLILMTCSFYPLASFGNVSPSKAEIEVQLKRASAAWLIPDSNAEMMTNIAGEELAKTLVRMGRLKNFSKTDLHHDLPNELAWGLFSWLVRLPAERESGLPRAAKVHQTIELLTPLLMSAISGSGKSVKIQRELIESVDGYFRWYIAVPYIMSPLKLFPKTNLYRLATVPDDYVLLHQVFQALRKQMRQTCAELLASEPKSDSELK